eukprot:gene5879-7316_t
MFVSSNSGVDSIECGYSIDQPCKSIQSALKNFQFYNITEYQSIYPSLVLELDYGVYSGTDNNNIDLYQYNITIKSPSQNNNNNQIVNLIPTTSQDSNSYSKGAFLQVDHTSNQKIPNIYINIIGLSITGSIIPANPVEGFIFIGNSTKNWVGTPNTYVFFNMKNCTFSNNKAAGYVNIFSDIYTSFGIMSNHLMTNITIDNSLFTQNSANYIINVYGNATITNTKFLNNTSNYGCLSADFNILLVDGCSFVGNKASYSGGAIQCSAGYFYSTLTKYESAIVSNSQFIENSANGRGGTFDIEVVKTFWINNCIIQTQEMTILDKGPLIFCSQSNITSINSTYQSQTNSEPYQDISNSEMKSLIECLDDEDYLCTFGGQLNSQDLDLCKSVSPTKPRFDLLFIIFVLVLVPLIVQQPYGYDSELDLVFAPGSQTGSQLDVELFIYDFQNRNTSGVKSEPVKFTGLNIDIYSGLVYARGKLFVMDCRSFGSAYNIYSMDLGNATYQKVFTIPVDFPTNVFVFPYAQYGTTLLLITGDKKPSITYTLFDLVSLKTISSLTSTVKVPKYSDFSALF